MGLCTARMSTPNVALASPGRGWKWHVRAERWSITGVSCGPCLMQLSWFLSIGADRTTRWKKNCFSHSSIAHGIHFLSSHCFMHCPKFITRVMCNDDVMPTHDFWMSFDQSFDLQSSFHFRPSSLEASNLQLFGLIIFSGCSVESMFPHNFWTYPHCNCLNW